MAGQAALSGPGALASVVAVRPAADELPDVLVLNGVSSSGKSSLARELQVLLPRPYLVLGVDTLVDAVPASLLAQDDGLSFHSDGVVEVGAAFTALEDAWYAGLAAAARAGAPLILDEVLLGGGRSQRRLAAALEGLVVRWVAVRCDVQVAVAREAARPDRTVGMAAAQAPLVHAGVTYDVSVDTSRDSSAGCARAVVDALQLVASRAPARPSG